MSTDLVKQNALVPKEESSSDSNVEFRESQQSQKKSFDEESENCLGEDVVMHA